MTVYLANGQKSLEDSTETLTCKETRSDSEHVHVVAGRVTTLPHEIENGPNPHSDSVVNLGNNERESDGIPVGDVDVIAFRNVCVLCECLCEWNINDT